MLENYCKFFKSNGGWCVIIPCSLEENEEVIIKKIKNFHEKLKEDDFQIDDPLLKSLLKGNKIKLESSEKEKKNLKLFNIKEESLFIFPKKEQALFFIGMIYDIEGSPNNNMPINKIYKIATTQIND